jgi:anti-sigma factor RsiW
VTTASAAPATLAAGLERDRLEARAARLDRVVVALRARARAYADGAVPPPLRRSLADFEHERAQIRSRLDRGG